MWWLKNQTERSQVAKQHLSNTSENENEYFMDCLSYIYSLFFLSSTGEFIPLIACHLFSPCAVRGLPAVEALSSQPSLSSFLPASCDVACPQLPLWLSSWGRWEALLCFHTQLSRSTHPSPPRLLPLFAGSPGSLRSRSDTVDFLAERNESASVRCSQGWGDCGCHWGNRQHWRRPERNFPLHKGLLIAYLIPHIGSNQTDLVSALTEPSCWGNRT